MRMHQVEVDDEIFSFVKEHAEPLVDTFNTALHKLLPLNSKSPNRPAALEPRAGTRNGIASKPSFPSGTPQALRQILEVILLVRGGAYSRTEATRFVAKQYGVHQQTVNDKYGRQLGLTANMFDRLLEQDDLVELRRRLTSKFPQHIELIERMV